jgi:hypothetical protein
MLNVAVAANALVAVPTGRHPEASLAAAALNQRLWI